MIRKLFILMLILSPIVSLGQKKNRVLESGLPLDTPNNLVRFREVIVKDATQAKIYAAALKYFNSKHLVEGTDASTGDFYGRVAFHGTSYFSGINYKFKFEFAARDGKYRYTFSNINLEGKGGPIESILNSSLMGRAKFIESIQDDFRGYIDQMKNSINKEIADEF